VIAANQVLRSISVATDDDTTLGYERLTGIVRIGLGVVNARNGGLNRSGWPKDHCKKPLNQMGIKYRKFYADPAYGSSAWI